jgi:hypothetical protein
MALIDNLPSSTGKRSKEANKIIAKEITDKSDHKSIKELLKLLDNKDRNIQSDSIEVLYETGYLKPDLIADYYEIFLELLNNKNNRLVWGAMIALSSISKIIPEDIFKVLPIITKAFDKGSVITKDAGVSVYVNLARIKNQKTEVLPILFDELKKCPDKQLAQYAEKSYIAIDEESKETFLEIINLRLKSLEKESQIKRLKKVIKSITDRYS